MNRETSSFLLSWPFDPWLLVGLVITAGIYLRGWAVLRRRNAARWQPRQLIAFLGGLGAILLALGSPVETFSAFFLSVHMVQHLLLMMAAPPLLWLGEPLFPLLRGLPAPVRSVWVAPLFQSRLLRGFFTWLTHPAAAGSLYVIATWAWHVPALYETAVRSSGWHYVQHMTFLVAGLLFWYPVVRPYPARPAWSRWLLFPYLLFADVQNTVLAAILTFSGRVIYPYYTDVPRLGGFSALEDQAAAGVIMWVPGSVAFLVPLFWIALRALFGNETTVQPPGRLSLPMASAAKESPWDLLRVPGLGRFLRWRHARLCLQIPMVVLAGALIYDGLRGPRVAPMNLAGVLPWIHWRGALILGLLAVGNVFCMACPFMVPRAIARRFAAARLVWPRPFRNKWTASALLILFLWAYEAFALWDSPWLTAWIIAGYFVAALVVDGLFRGAAFCKYLCPIGQFNFVQSLVSPWEVKMREAEVCATCRTHECIRGGTAGRGCEMNLFIPRKASNFDCTLCLDCIHACPHDNIGLVATAPAAELWDDRHRSGVGRFGKRPDLAALVLVLVFGAFANAAGMIGPVAEWQDDLRERWGLSTPFAVVTICYFAALVVLPFLVVFAAASLSRWWGGLTASRLQIATRCVYALVPIGFAMWLSHYSFHLLTSYDAATPPVQRFVAELGVNVGAPEWVCTCCRPVMEWIPRFEIFVLDLGLLASLYVAYRIAPAVTRDQGHALRVLAPWAVVIVLLFALGVWLVLQPMQMRGTLQMGG